VSETRPPTSERNPTFEVDSEGIGWITFNDSARSLNVLDEEVMHGLDRAVERAHAAGREGRASVIVFRSGKPDSFIAGADVGAIEALEDPVEAENKVKNGQAVFSRVAALPVPSVAAVHGVAVGGGLELGLACTHRVLSDSSRTRVGLPEVMLGILPAWGGTTRLPRLIGLRASLDLLLTGKQISARAAKRIGLADEVVPAELFEAQIRRFALAARGRRGAGKRSALGRVGRALERTAWGRKLVLRAARKKVMSTTGGHYPAPLRILDVLEEGFGASVEQSLSVEARAAAELIVSAICKNLIHVYHLREATRKGTGVAEADVSPRPIASMGVLGAGVMGGGIAQLAAAHGIRVFMKDIRHEAVSGGLRHARSIFDKAVERRKLSRPEANRAMELISGGLEYHGLATAELMVEAVVEKLEVKRAVLREAEQAAVRECLLATNTSSLSVDAMAEALAHPERFCGMHFFNPVHRMPLVEVVRGSRSSTETIATVYALALRLGKVPVVVGDGPGFLVNRILGPYLNEAGYLLGDGATIQEVDSVAKAFGMPMGPLRLIDEVGIDVSRHAGNVLHKELGERLAPSPVLVLLGGTDRLGRKGGRGFYLYENGREKGVDETVYGAVGLTPPQGDSPRGEREVRRRLVTLMINEAARILEEGIVASAADVDLAMIMGTGFPPFRGGLLRFADTLHSRTLLEGLRELQRVHGDRFEPAPLVIELAGRGGGFYEAFPSVPAEVGRRRSAEAAEAAEAGPA
jgi:3-hydroxyacyl-CoA dehydrogenase/enoyl-CoA hydratase/3-hydroxybutyryl-CoA epimerase